VSRAPLFRTSGAHCALGHPVFPKGKLCDMRAKICDVFIEISQFQIRRYGVKPETKTFPTRDEAKIWTRLIESEIDRGIYVSRYEA
jgi:hypothetical protein